MKRLKPLGNKSGFSLCEIVITMQIVVTIFLLTLFIPKHTLERYEEELFIQNFQLIVDATQVQAIADRGHGWLAYNDQKKQYQAVYTYFSPLILSLPPCLEEKGAHSIRYNYAGARPASKTVFFSSKYEHHFQWQIGGGKYRYERKEKELFAH